MLEVRKIWQGRTGTWVLYGTAVVCAGILLIAATGARAQIQMITAESLHGPGRTYCTQQYDPVCGSDGRTYSNDCTARSIGVGVVYDGMCLTMATPAQQPVREPWQWWCWRKPWLAYCPGPYPYPTPQPPRPIPTPYPTPTPSDQCDYYNGQFWCPPYPFPTPYPTRTPQPTTYPPCPLDAVWCPPYPQPPSPYPTTYPRPQPTQSVPCPPEATWCLPYPTVHPVPVVATPRPQSSADCSPTASWCYSPLTVPRAPQPGVYGGCPPTASWC